MRGHDALEERPEARTFTGAPPFLAFLNRTGTDPVNSKAYALVADGTWAFSNETEASIGLRYYCDDRETINYIAAGLRTSAKASFSSTSPRFNLLHKWNEGTSTYATAAKGLRSGGFNSDDSTFDAEDLWSYELGTKAALMGGRLYLDGAVYYLDYKNRQSQNVVGLFAVTTNGGKASGPGIELAMTSRLDHGLVSLRHFCEEISCYNIGVPTYEERTAMAQPWLTIERSVNGQDVLELRRRGERDFLLLVNGRVLMNSGANRSEIALGEQASRMVAGRPRPRVLIGGLGMGFTLRAALDVLPPSGQVIVAELSPAIVDWCRGPLAGLTQCAVSDPRVLVETDDVAAVIITASRKGAERYDAIIIDLYVGPGADTDAHFDPYYGSHALQMTARALTPGGVFAIWGENPDPSFEKRLSTAGFDTERLRPGRGGLRHVVYLAKKRGGLLGVGRVRIA